MPKNYDTDFTVTDSGEDILIANENTQRFKREDFVELYEDTLNRLKQLQSQYENTEEETVEMLDEKEDAMHIIHSLVKTEEANSDEEPDYQPNSLTVDDLNAFMQLQQKKQQQQQTVNQLEQVRDQLESMRPVADKISEEGVKELPEPV